MTFGRAINPYYVLIMFGIGRGKKKVKLRFKADCARNYFQRRLIRVFSKLKDKIWSFIPSPLHHPTQE